MVSSSAFPDPFTPLTFKNYPKFQCGYQEPDWADETLARLPEENPEQFVWAQNLHAYEDAKAWPYIHVMDGGIAGNLGLRPIPDHFWMQPWDLWDAEKRIKAKRIIRIAVNASSTDDMSIDLFEKAGADLFAKSPAFQKLIRDLRATCAGADPCAARAGTTKRGRFVQPP